MSTDKEILQYMKSCIENAKYIYPRLSIKNEEAYLILQQLDDTIDKIEAFSSKL